MQLLASSLYCLDSHIDDSSDAALAEKDTFKPGKVQIVGVSHDTVEKQKLFVKKEKLTVSWFGFPLMLIQVMCSSHSIRY